MSILKFEHNSCFLWNDELYFLKLEYLKQCLCHVYRKSLLDEEPEKIFEITLNAELEMPIFFMGHLFCVGTDKRVIEIYNLDGDCHEYRLEWNTGWPDSPCYEEYIANNFKFSKMDANRLIFSFTHDNYYTDVSYKIFTAKNIRKFFRREIDPSSAGLCPVENEKEILLNTDSGFVLALNQGNLVQTKIIPNSRVIFGQRTTQIICSVSDLPQFSKVRSIYDPEANLAFCVFDSDQLLKINLTDNTYTLKKLNFEISNFFVNIFPHVIVVASASSSKVVIQTL